MIHSFFVINTSGDVFIEKHWKKVIHRSVCDYFFEVQKRVASPEEIPPVISTPHHYLINIFRSKMFFVAVTMSEGEDGTLFHRNLNEVTNDIEFFLFCIFILFVIIFRVSPEYRLHICLVRFSPFF
ncbi:unnamed protein product [Ixodes pacificus]